MRVLLLTGPGGDAQGWGDLEVTKTVAEAIDAVGHASRIAFVETEADFLAVLDEGRFDLAWSALYHVSPNAAFIGRNDEGMWVADVFDRRGIPYVGSNSRTMKDMIDKFQTHSILSRHGVPVPSHALVRAGDDVSAIRYPAFVKPMGESRSVGISDQSVVYSEGELRRQARFIEQQFGQPALVEDFLPGDEYTVLVLGNGDTRECLPGLVSVEEKHYGRHKVLRSDLRGVGLTRISRVSGAVADEAAGTACRAAGVMGCLDHVRIDLKAGADGRLRIIEVNGIPGLKPHKSWTPQLFTLYHGSPETELRDYRRLIAAILDSACQRYGWPSRTR